MEAFCSRYISVFIVLALVFAQCPESFSLAPPSKYAHHAKYPEELPKKLHALLEKTLGTSAVMPDNLPTWDEQRLAIGKTLHETQQQLSDKNQNGLIRFMMYLAELTSDEGYRDELEFLHGQMLKEKGGIPAVFNETPMRDKEYVLIKVEATGYEDAQKDRITEITAVRYRGLQKIGEFHSLVNPQRDIPQDMVAKVGITQDMVENAPVFADVADGIREFAGELPMVMQFGKFHMVYLNEELARLGQEPLLNEVIDTVEEARKVMPHLDSHGIASIWKTLGFEPRGELRGAAYMRMYFWALQQIALMRKQSAEQRFYDIFLKRFAASPEIVGARYYREMKAKFGERVERIRSWQEIIPFVQEHGIQRIFLDFDMTVFRSKGYYNSDPYVSKRLTLEEPREFVVNEFIAGDDFLVGELNFVELVELDVPDVLLHLQKLGVEIIVWTARGKNTGEEEKVKAQFQKIGVHIETVVLCEGRKKEGMEDWYKANEKGGNAQRPPTLVIDDSASNIRKVITDSYLGHNLYALVAKFVPEGHRDEYCWDYVKSGYDALKGGQADNALGCFMNAFRLALEKETPTTIEKVIKVIRTLTEAHATDAKVRKLWLFLDEKGLAKQLSQMTMSEPDRKRFGILLPSYIAAIPKIDPEIRVPTIVDAADWAQHTEPSPDAMHTAGCIIPIGKFQQVWDFSQTLTRLDAALAQKIYWPREYVEPSIPEALRSLLAQLDWFASPLVAWEHLRGGVAALERSGQADAAMLFLEIAA